MTHGVLADESLAALDPALVSPALLPLVAEEAPTRTILCAGAGHFAAAEVTLSPGFYIGAGADAGQRLAGALPQVVDREGSIIPAYGFTQAEREVASAAAARDRALA